MTLVKGSKKMRVKVIEYQMRNVLLVAFFLCSVLLVGIFANYLLGFKKGMAGQEQALADVSRFSRENTLLAEQLALVEQQLENSKVASQVDQQANEDVRKEVLSFKDEIARLTEENNFYRGLMAPNEKSSGLVMGAVELVAGGAERTYSYKVVVQQLATRHNLLSGSIRIDIVGVEGGLEARYSLMALSPEVGSESVKLRFKYFQVLEGSLILPEGFAAEGLEIEAKVGGKKPQMVSKKYGWLVEER